MSSSFMLNGRSKDSFSEQKAQVVLLSDDDSAARIGGTVMESYGNIKLLITCNRYLLEFLRETVRLSIVYDDIVRRGRTDNTVEKRGHLKKKAKR